MGEAVRDWDTKIWEQFVLGIALLLMSFAWFFLTPITTSTLQENAEVSMQSI